jgi:hypothetical protein
MIAASIDSGPSRQPSARSENTVSRQTAEPLGDVAIALCVLGELLLLRKPEPIVEHGLRLLMDLRRAGH